MHRLGQKGRHDNKASYTVFTGAMRNALLVINHVITYRVSREVTRKVLCIGYEYDPGCYGRDWETPQTVFMAI